MGPPTTTTRRVRRERERRTTSTPAAASIEQPAQSNTQATPPSLVSSVHAFAMRSALHRALIRAAGVAAAPHAVARLPSSASALSRHTSPHADAPPAASRRSCSASATGAHVCWSVRTQKLCVKRLFTSCVDTSHLLLSRCDGSVAWRAAWATYTSAARATTSCLRTRATTTLRCWGVRVRSTSHRRSWSSPSRRRSARCTRTSSAPGRRRVALVCRLALPLAPSLIQPPPGGAAPLRRTGCPTQHRVRRVARAVESGALPGARAPLSRATPLDSTHLLRTASSTCWATPAATTARRRGCLRTTRSCWRRCWRAESEPPRPAETPARCEPCCSQPARSWRTRRAACVCILPGGTWLRRLGSPPASPISPGWRSTSQKRSTRPRRLSTQCIADECGRLADAETLQRVEDELCNYFRALIARRCQPKMPPIPRSLPAPRRCRSRPAAPR